MRWFLLLSFLIASLNLSAQNNFELHFNALRKQAIDNGIMLTFDEPMNLSASKPTKIILFALPNGNTTAQTFGKTLAQGDDWHFDIQHIGAQTSFIRNADPKANYIIVYIENDLKSWPAWRRKYASADEQIGKMVHQLLKEYGSYRPKLILSGHSGGGSFIFGYINSQDYIPASVERIGFIDATYGYETETHLQKLKKWLKIKNTSLQVIAYNDSVVFYNDKPLVSLTGGTWYRSKLMAKDLEIDQKLRGIDLTDRVIWYNRKQLVSFTLIKNPEAKIFHTVLVERNGFIDLIFKGTRLHSRNYQFWGARAYGAYILK